MTVDAGAWREAPTHAVEEVVRAATTSTRRAATDAGRKTYRYKSD